MSVGRSHELRAVVQTNRRSEGLAACLERHKGERHIIVLQSFPDPDAIAAAFAHSFLSSSYEIQCEIAYDGIISHHENIALVELLDLPLKRVSSSEDFSRFDGCVFVDNQGSTSGLTDKLIKQNVRQIAVIDHHEQQGILRPEFSDIREEVSATSTIYVEYLFSGQFTFDKADPEYIRLSTALMHGIRSDSGGFINAREADFLAASHIAQSVDSTLLTNILSLKRSRNVIDVIKTALEEREVRDNYSVAGVGYVRYEDRDAIPQAADFLLTEENVHTAIVYGVISKPGERELIVGSLRTNKTTFNPDLFLKEALGGPEQQRYYGGGRRGSGGFEIPVGFLAGSNDQTYMDLKWQLYDQQIRHKLWSRLGVSK
jgi:nanoRNase/pAp phosphatase (c-di-AMP/oligoRNAs hydrolase)